MNEKVAYESSKVWKGTLRGPDTERGRIPRSPSKPSKSLSSNDCVVKPSGATSHNKVNEMGKLIEKEITKWRCNKGIWVRDRWRAREKKNQKSAYAWRKRGQEKTKPRRDMEIERNKDCATEIAVLDSQKGRVQSLPSHVHPSRTIPISRALLMIARTSV